MTFFLNRPVKSEKGIDCVHTSVVCSCLLIYLPDVVLHSWTSDCNQAINTMLKPRQQLRCEVFFYQHLSHNHPHLKTGALNEAIMGNICWLNHLCCNSRGLKCGLHYKNVVKHLLKDLLVQLTVFSFTADMFALSYMIVCVGWEGACGVCSVSYCNRLDITAATQITRWIITEFLFWTYLTKSLKSQCFKAGIWAHLSLWWVSFFSNKSYLTVGDETQAACVTLGVTCICHPSNWINLAEDELGPMPWM